MRDRLEIPFIKVKSMYNDIFTKDDLIADNPDLVRRFVEASYKGFDYAMANREKAVDILVRYQPEIDKEIAIQELDIAFELMSPVIDAGASGKALGIMEQSKVEATIKFVREGLGLEVEVPVDDIYTNQFVSS